MTRTITLATLKSDRPTEVTFEANAAERAEIAQALGILAVRKLRLTGRLIPAGRRDWRLEATLGATAEQACVVTLEPVTTRVDVPVARRYLSDFEEPEGGTEVEMPEDDTAEALPAELDLARVATEALALSLPEFPRADGAELGAAHFTEPGKTAMTDDDAKPFASLQAFRDKLGRKP